MDIVLLLQSENVQVALQKSQEHVPPVLRRDLDILVGQLEMEPESVLPYHRFLKSFQIPEVHSAMSMLFSVSMGNSGRADRQIGELIDRNLEMLDVAEKGRLKNLSSGMYLLFLAPVLTASLKLLVDMAVFMMTFLSGAGLGYKGGGYKMSQIMKAFMGVFLTLFMAVTAMGILAAYMEVMNAQDMQARIVDEIENSDFNTGVVRQCFLQSEEAGYQLKVTFFNENSTVATVSQVSQIPYGMDGVDMAKIEMQFPFQVAFLGINRQHTFVSYAK